MIADLLQKMDAVDIAEAAELFASLYAARTRADNARIDAERYSSSADAVANEADAEADSIREDLEKLLGQYLPAPTGLVVAA